jgi:hypothetical protein
MATEELIALAPQVARKSSDDGRSLGDLYRESRERGVAQQYEAEASMLREAPSYVKLHNDLQSSRSLLNELESFLKVFYTDLNILSSQMSQLQGKSVLLGQQLRNRRLLEGRLRGILSDIVLEPEYVELIFADDATAGKAGLEAWKACAERLSACLLACSDLEGVLREEMKRSSTQQHPAPSLDEVKALREARDVVEACRVMAVTKIRPLLISTFAPLRSSLSTNMPVLQAVLLKSYRPLFMFLSHHAPRVAIDVQRAYVAAARLYFETGFRRYERSLGKLRDRVKLKMGASETSGAVAAATGTHASTYLPFTEPARAAGVGALASVAFLAGGSSSSSFDPWSVDAGQLDNAKIADGPAVTLAYFADDASHQTSLEALFRSLSLTFLDNASSEYCFLARFFEGIDLDTGSIVRTNADGSQTTGSSAVKVQHSDVESMQGGVGEAGANVNDDDDGPLPGESASAKGDDDEDEEEKAGTVAQLSRTEKKRLRGRGALDGLWKQVMEPVIGTYTHFVNSILALHPPLLPLYTMLKLNDAMLAEAEQRGTDAVLQMTLMSFKLKAWPTLQRQFDDAIEAVKRLRTSSPSSSVGGMAATATSLLGGFFGGASSSTSTASQAGAGAKADLVRLVCQRYANLFSAIAYLNSTPSNDGQEATIFGTLRRLRSELELLLADVDKPQHGTSTSDVLVSSCRLIRQTLEQGPASVSMQHIQAEMSHWAEAERTHTSSTRFA